MSHFNRKIKRSKDSLLISMLKSKKSSLFKSLATLGVWGWGWKLRVCQYFFFFRDIFIVNLFDVLFTEKSYKYFKIVKYLLSIKFSLDILFMSEIFYNITSIHFFHSKKKCDPIPTFKNPKKNFLNHKKSNFSPRKSLT